MNRRDRAIIDRLRQIEPFTACTDRQLAHIARRSCEQRVRAGATLAAEGRPGREFFAIVDGTATVLVADWPVARLGPGDVFGEVALLDWGNRTATVVADTELMLRVFSTQEFDEILSVAPSVARKVLVSLSRRLRAADEVLARCGPV